MVSKKICFYVSKIKNNVNYKWLRERERERERRARTISMLSLNLWCMLSVKILINVIDTNDAKLQSMSSSFPYSNMILTCHKPRHFYLRFIFFKNYLVHLFITECKEHPTLPQPPISSSPTHFIHLNVTA